MKVKNFNLVALALVLFCLVAYGQETQSSSGGQQPGQPPAPGQTQSAQEGEAPAPALTPPPTASDGTVTSLHDGGPLQALPGMLHGGPLYIGSVSMTGSYERDGGNLTRGLGILSTYVFFTKAFHKDNKLSLQYAPQVAVVDGKFAKDFGGHEAQFDSAFQLTSRLRMAVHDGFHFAGLETQALQSGLLADSASGYSRQTDPLQHSGTFWVNEAQLSFAYDVSARTKLSFQPDYSVVRSSNTTAQQGMRYGTTVRIDHEVSPRTTVGGVYSADFSSYEAALSDTLYQRFGFSFGHTFGHGWMVSADLAAGTSSSQSRNTWTPEPTVSVSKAFRRSGVALVFNRTNAFLGLRNGYINQVDGTYHISLGRRYQWSFGGGTYRQSGTGTRNDSAYGTTSFAVSVLRNVSWSAAYMHRNQTGDTSFLQSGVRNLISTSIVWSPGRQQASE